MGADVDTVVVGGGQAGLAASYYLKEHDLEHVVLERNNIAASWRNRWDLFTLVTPNWSMNLPGFPYQGGNPDGFLTRDEIVSHLEAYAAHFNAPIRTGVSVTSVTQGENGYRFNIQTDADTYEARNIIIATGGFPEAKIPSHSNFISPDIFQLHTNEYRRPEMLPDGAVLVVGSGQSGAQVAEELYKAGRRVFLSVGSAGRVPRRYRGRDITQWVVLMPRKTVDQLESPKQKFAPNPHVTGKDGGRSLNLHTFAADGVILLGRMKGAQGKYVMFADDLKDTLKKIDEGEARLKVGIDKFIETRGLDAPKDDADPIPPVGYSVEVITELDLEAHGISSIIWATGYRLNFDWVKFPIFDEDGYPVQKRGVTDIPGLYFLGLPWLHTQLSSLLIGVGEDAKHVVSTLFNTHGEE